MKLMLRNVSMALVVAAWVLLGTSALLGQVKIYTKEAPPPTPKLEDLPLKESVTQYGITWTFDKPTRVGQFVNGDFYVVGDTTIKMIDPKPLWGDEVKEKINKESIKEDQYPGRQARHGKGGNSQSGQELGHQNLVELVGIHRPRAKCARPGDWPRWAPRLAAADMMSGFGPAAARGVAP